MVPAPRPQKSNWGGGVLLERRWQVHVCHITVGMRVPDPPWGTDTPPWKKLGARRGPHVAGRSCFIFHLCFLFIYMSHGPHLCRRVGSDLWKHGLVETESLRGTEGV